MRQVTDLYPDGRWLSVRRAEHMTPDDTVNDIAVHQPGAARRDAVLDVTDLQSADDDGIVDCRVLDPSRVMAVVSDDDTGTRPRHTLDLRQRHPATPPPTGLPRTGDHRPCRAR